jgi:hypothetical protein
MPWWGSKGPIWRSWNWTRVTRKCDWFYITHTMLAFARATKESTKVSHFLVLRFGLISIARSTIALI